MKESKAQTWFFSILGKKIVFSVWITGEMPVPFTCIPRYISRNLLVYLLPRIFVVLFFFFLIWRWPQNRNPLSCDVILTITWSNVMLAISLLIYLLNSKTCHTTSEGSRDSHWRDITSLMFNVSHGLIFGTHFSAKVLLMGRVFFILHCFFFLKKCCKC